MRNERERVRSDGDTRQEKPDDGRHSPALGDDDNRDRNGDQNYEVAKDRNLVHSVRFCSSLLERRLSGVIPSEVRDLPSGGSGGPLNADSRSLVALLLGMTPGYRSVPRSLLCSTQLPLTLRSAGFLRNQLVQFGFDVGQRRAMGACRRMEAAL